MHLFLIQAASSTLTSHATEIGITALLGINLWQVKATLAFRDEARTLRQWAFGVEGGNGANGQLKDHEERIHDLEAPHTHKRKSDP